MSFSASHWSLNQTHLRGLLKTKRRQLAKAMRKQSSTSRRRSGRIPPERWITLYHCLNELKYHSLVEEIQRYLRSGSLSKAKLSPGLWSPLVPVLLTSEEELDVFYLNTYSRSEEGLLRLLPAVKASRTALPFYTRLACHLSISLQFSPGDHVDPIGEIVYDVQSPFLCEKSCR
jgi:hypothetical protein